MKMVYIAIAPRHIGYFRWKMSNIRQWLNSSNSAKTWFNKQHEFDEPPTENPPYSPVDKFIDENGYEFFFWQMLQDWSLSESTAYYNDPGFLKGFSNEVKKHFTQIKNKTAYQNINGEVIFDYTEDCVFLPSAYEIGAYFDDNKNHSWHERWIYEGKNLSYTFPLGGDIFDQDILNSLFSNNFDNQTFWIRSSNRGEMEYGDGNTYYFRMQYGCTNATDYGRGEIGICPLIVLH